MNLERRKFLRSVFWGAAFLFVAKSFVPTLSFFQRHLNKDVWGDLSRTENDREIIFCDKTGKRVLIVEK